jgi:hypothetical protein
MKAVQDTLLSKKYLPLVVGVGVESSGVRPKKETLGLE